MKFDIEEAKKAGVFISGARASGKSNLAMQIADRLLKANCIIEVFDNSRAWLKSSIPYVIQVEENSKLEIDHERSCVFDLALLYAQDQKELIAKIIKEEFYRQVRTPENQRKWKIYVFEEAQMLLPQNHLRAREAQEILRLVSAGRNFEMSYILITQRPSLIDQTALALSSQRYFGKIESELDREKIEPWIGKDFASKLSGLKCGQFVYDMGDHSEIISTPLFASPSKPKRILPTPIYAPKPTLKPKPQASQQAIGALITWIGFALFLIWLVLK